MQLPFAAAPWLCVVARKTSGTYTSHHVDAGRILQLSRIRSAQARAMQRSRFFTLRFRALLRWPWPLQRTPHSDKLNAALNFPANLPNLGTCDLKATSQYLSSVLGD